MTPVGSADADVVSALTASEDEVVFESTESAPDATARPFDGGELPWGYADNRITALSVSPDQLYVHWEITDERILDARRRLGAAGASGWCNLRVYDTTNRWFDGTNANDYFDMTVERGQREWFFHLRRPGASFHVEIGIKSHEGYFQAIARSGRADLPRKSLSPHRALDWMTVSDGVGHPTARPYQSRYVPQPWSPPPPSAPGGHHATLPGSSWTSTAQSTIEGIEGPWQERWSWDDWHTEWRLFWLGPLVRSGFAVAPLETASWRVGPFPIALSDLERIDLQWIRGEPFLLEELRSGLIVFGPWQVTIRSAAGSPERRVLGTWRVSGARLSPLGWERWWTAIERRRNGSFRRELVVGGASESRALVDVGASEQWRLGASERFWVGASEWLALGGSETLAIGASERMFVGASALLWGGASELAWGGASALLWGGASELAWGGASEVAWGGASELAWGGASEAGVLGGSESAWPGASESLFSTVK